MFTPELVKSLMESSKDEAKDNLHRKFALQALAEEENIKIDEKEVETKVKELKQELAGEKNIDHQRLREAVSEDLLEGKLIQWLEENNNVIETSPNKKVETSKSSSKPKQTKVKTESSTKTRSKSEKSDSEKPKS